MGLKMLVTGGSGGIGRATALRFSKDSHEVFITGRSEARLEETVSLAKGLGGGVVQKTVGDVGVEADVQRNYEEAIKTLGHIDVLVLNAGASKGSRFEDHTAADFDNIFNSNVRGTFLWLKAVLPTYIQETRLWANCDSQQLIWPISECSLLLDLCCLKVCAHRNGGGSLCRSGEHCNQSGICVSRCHRHKHMGN